MTPELQELLKRIQKAGGPIFMTPGNVVNVSWPQDWDSNGSYETAMAGGADGQDRVRDALVIYALQLDIRARGRYYSQFVGRFGYPFDVGTYAIWIQHPVGDHCMPEYGHPHYEDEVTGWCTAWLEAFEGEATHAV